MEHTPGRLPVRMGSTQEAMFPDPTDAEIAPFGDDVYRELDLEEAGKMLCNV